MKQQLATGTNIDAQSFAQSYCSNGSAEPRLLVKAEKIRLSEVIAALSVALDITQGHSNGHCMRSCLIGMRIAEEISLDEASRSALFYALLLKDLGCSSNAARISYLFDADDLSTKHSLRMIDWTRPAECFRHFWKHMNQELSLWQKMGKVVSAAKQGPEAGRKLTEIRCNRGAEIARMLQLPEATASAILDIDELWNGAGAPLGKKGEEISLLGRICCLAQTMEVFYFRNNGPDEAYNVARARKGRWFDPDLVAAFVAFENDDAFWQQLESENLVRELGQLEPLDQIMIADDACIDRVAEAFARVVDAKSPWTFQHSARVADIAVGVATEMGYARDIVKDVRRAALLHDVGKLGVSNMILDKPSKPTKDEFAKIQLHPEYTFRILSQVSAFEELAFVAAGHHEKLDGSGYHLGLRGEQIPEITRILTVADIFEALTAVRPYRDAMPVDRVREIMGKDVGRALDSTCYAALENCLERGMFDANANEQAEQIEESLQSCRC